MQVLAWQASLNIQAVSVARIRKCVMKDAECLSTMSSTSVDINLKDFFMVGEEMGRMKIQRAVFLERSLPVLSERLSS